MRSTGPVPLPSRLDLARRQAETLQVACGVKLRLIYDLDGDQFFAHDDSRPGCWHADRDVLTALVGLAGAIKTWDRVFPPDAQEGT